MSDPETFVTRWSRLKRQSDREKAVEETTPAPPPDASVVPDAEGEDGSVAARGERPTPAFDPDSLPPIESITASTDIRAFLQSGVPAELTRAALRRVWTSDPAIRDFIGIAENQWDFTDPTAMPGFGPLEATDDVRKLVAQAMGKLGDAAEELADATGAGAGDQAPATGLQCSTPAAEPELPTSGIQASGIPEGNRTEPPAVEAGGEQNRVDAAARYDQDPAERGPAPNRRGHGSALPQ